MDAESQDLIRELDPFAFFINHASAIRPLGGQERGVDPRYVFHTPYVAFRPGRVIFSVRFDRLQASFGELRVNINAFIPGSGRDAVFVMSSRLDMSDRIATERGLSIAVLTVAGASYAAYGFCVDGTDARAEGVTITAEEIAAPDGMSDEQLLLPTQFGAHDLDTPVRLVTEEPPRFRDPISQPMTGAQLAEPEYRAWIDQLGRESGDPKRGWPIAFIAQALDRYGMLRPGGRGIGLGEGAAELGLIAVGRGCEAMLALFEPDLGNVSLSWGEMPCAPIDAVPGPDGLIGGAPLSMADRPPDQRGFDFLWSVGLANRGHAAGNCANLLIEAMTVLRPGGYAVHIFDFATGPGAPADALPRTEVERIAVTLISRGHTVAQLNFASGVALAEPDIPFGLIVRKGL